MGSNDQDVLAAYPAAGIDHDNLALYRGLYEGRLLLHRCRQCRTWHHPPRSICPACWSDEIEAEEATGRGTIYMHTSLPHRDAMGSAQIVTADLDEQPSLRFTAPLIDATADEIAIGRRVELRWIESDGAPVPAFRLAR